MKLSDAKVQLPFVNGSRIYRCSNPAIRYYVDGGLICKETNDDKPQSRCVAAPYTLEDWQAEDWEVVHD